MDTPVAARSAAYDTFHPRIRQWIHRQGWRRLHEAQEHAALLILGAEHDVIVAAATAAGKTEAAWFPICSALLADTEARRDQAGVKALCIAPSKALINDQYGRLGELGESLGIPVHRWHGDVAASQKPSCDAPRTGCCSPPPSRWRHCSCAPAPRWAGCSADCVTR
jgi:ATP-dependent Lhr-like helicase